MRRMIRSLALTAVMLGGSYAHARDLPNYTAYADEPALASVPGSRAAREATALGIVTSVDEHRAVPTFVWATRHIQQSTVLPPGLPPDRAAWAYLSRLAPLYRLSN